MTTRRTLHGSQKRTCQFISMRKVLQSLTLQSETAPMVLKEYFDKHGGRAAIFASKNVDSNANKKRKLEESPQPYTQKNGTKRKPIDWDDLDVHFDRKAARYPTGSWEDSVSKVDYIEEKVDPKTGELKRYAFIHWNDGKDPQHTYHPLHVLYLKCPQKVYRRPLDEENTADKVRHRCWHITNPTWSSKL